MSRLALLPLLVVVVACGTATRIDDVCSEIRDGVVCIDAEVPTAVQCFAHHPFSQPFACSAVCAPVDDTCTSTSGGATPDFVAAACHCTTCFSDDECAFPQFCQGGDIIGLCNEIAPGNWSVMSIAVEVPDLAADGLPWDATSDPDVQVRLTINGASWLTTPVGQNSRAVSWTFDASRQETLSGNEELGVDIFEIDGIQSTVIESVVFNRLAGFLSAGGYAGPLLEVDRQTFLDLRVQQETPAPADGP